MLAPSTPRIGRAGRWADSEYQRAGSEQADSEWARGHRPSAPERMEAAPSVRLGAKLQTTGTQSPEPAPAWAAGLCSPAAADMARAAILRAAPPQGPAAASCLGRTCPLQSGPAVAAAGRVSLPGEEMKAPMPRRGGAHCREEGRGRLRWGRAGRAMAQQTMRQDSDETAGAGDCCQCAHCPPAVAAGAAGTV
jgi:hypothetical protein